MTLFGPMVEYDQALPRILAAAAMTATTLQAAESHKVKSYMARDSELNSITSNCGATYVSYYNLLCKSDHCPTITPDGSPWSSTPIILPSKGHCSCPEADRDRATHLTRSYIFVRTLSHHRPGLRFAGVANAKGRQKVMSGAMSRWYYWFPASFCWIRCRPSVSCPEWSMGPGLAKAATRSRNP